MPESALTWNVSPQGQPLGKAFFKFSDSPGAGYRFGLRISWALLHVTGEHGTSLCLFRCWALSSAKLLQGKVTGAKKLFLFHEEE